MASILPLAVMAGIGLYALVQHQREQTTRSGLEITRALSTAVDAELSRAMSVLQAIGTAAVLHSGDLRAFHEVMKRVVATRPQWQSILLHEPHGRMLFSTNIEFGGVLPGTAEPESIAAAVRTREPVVGALAKGPQGNYAFPVRVPIVIDGAVRYVLSAILLPDGIADVLTRQRLPNDWVVSVFDAKRQRVARSRQHAESLGGMPAPTLQQLMDRAGDEGGALSRTLEGDLVHTAYSRSPATGWTVAIGIPPSFVDAGATRSLAAYGGGVLLSIALAIVAALALGRSIALPMQELRAAAQALGRREPLVRPATRIEEIEQVADSLAAAAHERMRGDAERDELLRGAQQAREIAEAANRSKDEFLAMLGHELRNPLGAIANASHLIDARDEAARAHARDVISRQVQHLARMTDDLLDAARAMTGKIVLQRHVLDLADAAAGALAALRASGRGGEHTFVQRVKPVWVDADPTRIEQIIANLLANAVKYTPAGGTISLSVDREGEHAVLRVTDTGIGMPSELAARVFEPFVQGERPLDRSYGGLGIGLTLVRRLAELHGGVAFAQSEGPGRGSTFTVRLPAVNAPPMKAARERGEKPAQPRDVFIVEDNADARETLKRLLEFEGHRVRVAVDGPSALQAMRESAPEIALIDIGLPKMDGYELARRICAEIDSARRPVLVAVTGYGLPEDRSRSAAAGFDVHLVKPVELAALNALLSGR